MDDDKKVNKKTEVNSRVSNMQSRWPLALVGLLAIIIIFMIGAFFGHLAARNHPFARDLAFMGRGNHMMGGGRLGGANQLNQNRLSGVVTAVNGSSFTLAGSGTTNTIQTDSNTKYTGGDKVAVNDSVTVLGSINNGSFTATRIVINP